MRRRASRYKRDVNYLFVDGYNIINSWQPLIELKNVSLEDARNELIDIMIEFSHTRREHIILVFDAYLVKKSGGKTYKKDGIDVIFTKEFETADHYIERQLDEIGRLTNVRVATSDNVEQQNKVNYVAKRLKEERVTALDEDIIHKLRKLKHDMSKKNS